MHSLLLLAPRSSFDTSSRLSIFLKLTKREYSPMEILLDIHHWQNVKSTYDGSIRT